MTRWVRFLLALLAGFAVIAAACGDDDDDGGAGGDGAVEGPAIVIGAQDFGESAILAEIYRQGLEAEGFTVSIQSLGGFRDIELAAFERGDINLAPEYAASMLEFLNEDESEATADAEETTGILQGYLDDLGLVALEPSDAVDTNTFAVTQETADEHGLEAISDLEGVAGDLTLGGPADCETNPFCIPGLMEVYGVEFGTFQPLDPSAVPSSLDAGAIDVGVIFSTSGLIVERGYVVLEDDQTMLAADNVVPVITAELQEAYGDDLTDRLNEISGALTTEELAELNKRFDIDREDADVIAQDWLESAGLI